jgi:hypothetical protein
MFSLFPCIESKLVSVVFEGIKPMPGKPIRTKPKSRIPKEITQKYLDDLEIRLGCDRFRVDDDELLLAKERGLGSWMREDLKERFNQLEAENTSRSGRTKTEEENQAPTGH